MAVRKLTRQPEGYTAFVPYAFPAKALFSFQMEIIANAARAERLIGKLDGITHPVVIYIFFGNNNNITLHKKMELKLTRKQEAGQPCWEKILMERDKI